MKNLLFTILLLAGTVGYAQTTATVTANLADVPSRQTPAP